MSRRKPRNRNNLPTEDLVDIYEPIHSIHVPEYVNWLHRQAKMGFANRVTTREAGFKIGPEDRSVMPELDDVLGVVLGYSHD